MLFNDAAAGKFNGSLVDAALIAGGVTDPHTIQRSEAKYFAIRQQFSHLVDGLRADQAGDPVLDRIELIHQTLYRHSLTGGYSADATDLATTLDTGVYNCASATLLFVALAVDIGLDARAVSFPATFVPLWKRPIANIKSKPPALPGPTPSRWNREIGRCLRHLFVQPSSRQLAPR